MNEAKEKELRELRDLVRASRDGFLNGQPYIFTYTDIEEHLTELLGEQVWPCPDCDSLGTEHAPNCKRIVAAAPAEAEKRELNTDKLAESIMAFLSMWNANFLLGRDALKNKLDEWLAAEAPASQPAAAPADETCDICGGVMVAGSPARSVVDERCLAQRDRELILRSVKETLDEATRHVRVADARALRALDPEAIAARIEGQP